MHFYVIDTAITEINSDLPGPNRGSLTETNTGGLVKYSGLTQIETADTKKVHLSTANSRVR